MVDVGIFVVKGDEGVRLELHERSQVVQGMICCSS